MHLNILSAKWRPFCLGLNFKSSCVLISGVVEDIFKIGSMAPGAMLFDASREFQVLPPGKHKYRDKSYISIINHLILSYWPLGDMEGIIQVYFSNRYLELFYEIGLR